MTFGTKAYRTMSGVLDYFTHLVSQYGCLGQRCPDNRGCIIHTVNHVSFYVGVAYRLMHAGTWSYMYRASRQRPKVLIVLKTASLHNCWYHNYPFFQVWFWPAIEKPCNFGRFWSHTVEPPSTYWTRWCPKSGFVLLLSPFAHVTWDCGNFTPFPWPLQYHTWVMPLFYPRLTDFWVNYTDNKVGI